MINYFGDNCCICKSKLVVISGIDNKIYAAPKNDVNYFKYFLVPENFSNPHFLYSGKTIYCKSCNYLVESKYSNEETFYIHKLFNENKRSVTYINIEKDVNISSNLFTSERNKPHFMNNSTLILNETIDAKDFNIDYIKEVIVFINKYIYNYDLM